MSETGGGKVGGKDEADRAHARRLKALTRSQPVPAPAADEPSDDAILRYLDGAASGAEREQIAAGIEASPYATARVAVLAAAQAETGDRRAAPAPANPRSARFVFHLAQ